MSGSNHLRETGLRHGIAAVSAGFGRRLHAIVAILRPRRVVEVGFVNLVPSDLLAGVAGNLSHHGCHGASGHVAAVVDGLARADRLEQDIVLDLIGVASSFPAPFVLAPDLAARDRRLSLAAEHCAGRIIVTSIGGAAEGIDADPAV